VGSFRAEIQTTSYGVPHVIADDFRGAGFGMGYAYAKSDICEIAPRWLTVSAQRSRYFGPNERVPFGPGDGTYTNMQSDFFWQRILDEDVVGRELSEPPPAGPTQSVRDMVSGYVAGYNRYLSDTGVDNIPDARCRGAEWVRPITERDVYLRALHWNMFLSSGSLVREYVDASPPVPGNPTVGADQIPSAVRIAEAASMKCLPLGPGSNMIALGRDATENGRGMLFANPHWYWDGPERFFEGQMTVRGKMNVYGAGLVGIPMIMFGVTDKVAWSHTLSTPKRFVVYKLKLAPDSPTSYIYEGQLRKMIPRTVTIEAKDAAGHLGKWTHTFWETHYGLVFENSVYRWNRETAYSVRDVAVNFRWLNQQLAMNQAHTVGEIDAAGRRYLGIGWLNTIAADSTGRVLYVDRSAVPHVTDAQLDACSIDERDASSHSGVADPRAPIVLDGSRVECEWGDDPATPVKGIFGPARLPQLARNDYVTNSNDSYWTNNPRRLLENFPRVMGTERTPRTLRTRIGLEKIEHRITGTDGYPGRRFSLPLLQSITMDNRVVSAELWRDDLVALCRRMPEETGVGPACDVLARWDLTENLDSPGAVLWRHFFETLDPAAMDFEPIPADLYTVPFDPADPINTPRGLATTNPRVADALKNAVADLRDTGVPLDAAYRHYQYAIRAGERIPIPGGHHGVGQYNVIHNKLGWVPGEGYPDIVIGSSFVMWVQFDKAGLEGRTVMTYSQSNNPTSQHHSDQTKLFSAKESKPLLFREAEILADPNLEITRICQPLASAACQVFVMP
jgi:acyl-homoserine-lactone acylase